MSNEATEQRLRGTIENLRERLAEARESIKRANDQVRDVLEYYGESPLVSETFTVQGKDVTITGTGNIRDYRRLLGLYRDTRQENAKIAAELAKR